MIKTNKKIKKRELDNESDSENEIEIKNEIEKKIVKKEINLINEEIKLINEEIYIDELDTTLKKSKHIIHFIFKNLYNYIIILSKAIFKIIKFIIRVSGIYLLWICLHYACSHLYVKLCVPNTVIGFLISPFMIATPHCQGLRWIVYNAANMITNMWIVIGTWICSTILIINKDLTNDNR